MTVFIQGISYHKILSDDLIQNAIILQKKELLYEIQKLVN